MRGRARLILGAAIVALLAPAADAQRWRDRGPPPSAYGAPYGYDRPRDGRQYDRRRYRRCDKGTGGTILGAIAGGLLGNGIAGRGDRGVGTIVGAGVGALAGREIDRGC
ncbi:glycine zipper 2TM domain-containing protein [Sphingomonas bacterium]|uniref:glycine zipper 2TM domain-containing protein n=1 Tax=Sphingomonas bacterium TaxID=1895847 RepID=UPI001575C56C|nr:glycine zipper 2TM domain-containing protein [Sphingomonas bacterium]